MYQVWEMLQAALGLFEATWEELIGLPSRQSAAEDPEVTPLCYTWLLGTRLQCYMQVLN